jgi:hypothetical protein
MPYIKPFRGAFKDKELKVYKNKQCGLCQSKGLIAHEKNGMIDSYWCSNCNNPLLPSETEGDLS